MAGFLTGKSCGIGKRLAFAACIFFVAEYGHTEQSPEPQRSVLVLYGERGDLPAIQAVEEKIRQVIHGSTSPPIELFSEYLDFARFPPGQHAEILVRYLRQRYAGRRIDLVVPLVGSSLEFVLAHREELFPAAPLVFGIVDERELRRISLPADATGIACRFDIERTIELILRLQPDSPEIAFVSGSAGFDRRWADETHKIMERLHSGVRERWIDGKSLDEALAEAAALPQQSAILFLSMLRDETGRATSSVDVVRDLARVSKAPIYGVSSQFLDVGAVGGVMFDFGDNGRRIAELILKTLRGESVPYGAPETQSQNSLIINWQALKKANLQASRLPVEAQIRFRPPGLWETHHAFILGVAGIILLQAGLITGLFLERLRRRRAEDRFRLAVEASPNGIVLMNEHRRIVLVNDCTRKLFGFADEELIGQEIDILVPERFRSVALMPALRPPAAPAAQRIGAGRELFGRRKDGREFPVEIEVSPIQSKGGTLFLAAIVDISSRRQAEAEARQYHNELTHLGRVEMLGEMAGSLAHELNQPLTCIMNNASAGRRYIAKGHADMPKLEALLKSVVSDARRAGEIIHGIRKMVRKGEEQHSSVNLNEIVMQVVPFVHSDALERNCALVTDLASELPPVHGNPVLLQQVLLNIILNGFDAMRETPIAERRLIIQTRSQPGGIVRVAVRDFGTGLPPENPERIFERFFSTKPDGLGMGLAIARSIITSHGGELSAANAQGRGACVHFSLPAATFRGEKRPISEQEKDGLRQEA